LPYSLYSLKEQTHLPEEIVIILKPSNDKSENVINKFSRDLNIKLIIQNRGNITDAVSMGIKASHGNLILFLDDDAIAEKFWVEKYLRLFKTFPLAGGFTGLTYKAFKIKDRIIKTEENFYEEKPTKIWLHRMPLDIYKDYEEFVSDSGIPSRILFTSSSILRSALLVGCNMGWRKEALIGNDLKKAFRESKIGALYEQYLASYSRLKGYYTYRVIDPTIAPIVWHIQHSYSLQRKHIWSEFWRSFDLAYNYWRLKHLKCRTSFPRYLLALIILSRKKSCLRIPAYIYGFVKGFCYNFFNYS
jgi:glycosyltransferase involved in cell wall biosynthesis